MGGRFLVDVERNFPTTNHVSQAHARLPEPLEWCADDGLDIDPMDTSYFLGRETLIPRFDSEMSPWRGKIFVGMFRNAGSAAGFFGLPANRVVELGTQVVL